MQVAVTGGTGFLGAHIVEALTEAGHDTVCLVRPTSDRRHLDTLGITQVPGSLDDPAALRRLVRDADAVIHAAGAITAPRATAYDRVNTDGTQRLIEACTQDPPDQFVYVSSLAAKGPSPTPTPLSVDTPPRPVSAYGASKLGGERVVKDYARNRDANATIVRPPALYGPRDRGLLGLFKSARHGFYPSLVPKDAHMSLLHGSDCARFIASLLEEPPHGTRIHEPSDGTVHTHATLRGHLEQALDTRRLRPLPVPAPLLIASSHLARTFGSLTGRTPMLNPDKVRELRSKHWLSDPASLTGTSWRPTTLIVDGLRTTHQWYKQEGWL